jgi:prolyl oligopeptidase
MMLFLVIGVISGACVTVGPTLRAAAASASDPYLWLEDVNGVRAMDWVKSQNTRTLGVLESDKRYAGMYADALRISTASDRIPMPDLLAGNAYNFWQDAEHVRGIWRTTTVDNYRSPAPAWATVLDLDALAKTENANWVWHGADCREPAEDRCLVSLSDGGEDASTIREFDVVRRNFVAGGFTLPRGKQDAAWESNDTLLVAREWNSGELTASGYPYIVKRLERGQSLGSAVEVYRGLKTDVGVTPVTLEDGQGNRAVVIVRNVSFFSSEYQLLTPRGWRKLNLPHKIETEALIADRLLFRLSEDWVVNGRSFAAGSLVSCDLAALSADPDHPAPIVLYAPANRESLASVAATHSRLIVVTYESVKGRAFAYAPESDGTWSRRKLDLPDNASIAVVATNIRNDDAFLSVTSFLAPTSLYLLNTISAELAVVKQSPARFDASRDVVEQFEARSKDGTPIPYFIVHPKNMTRDGANPTILYAYGGFAVSLTPAYSALNGKLWLERGGVYVVANIRGGGEFGPAWHEAGLKTHRQRVYDDFTAVADDLIARKITTPRRLGIQGGSNGGLLMGVEFTQHPELWHAVDIAVPLLDMLRYEQIAAGASWVGEYGSVSNPDERAFLASISPYANLKPNVAYPMPFIWTTTKDDRVGPQHARKFAAKLSALGIPYLFYEVVEGGHGAGANLQERAHTTTLEMVYFSRLLMD